MLKFFRKITIDIGVDRPTGLWGVFSLWGYFSERDSARLHHFYIFNGAISIPQLFSGLPLGSFKVTLFCAQKITLFYCIKLWIDFESVLFLLVAESLVKGENSYSN